MKRNTILKATLALSLMGVLILVGGCKSTSSKDDVKCPSCDKRVATFSPKKGLTYKKVACPTCKNVVTVNDQDQITGTKHICESCGVLVGECPKCATK